MSTGSKNSFLAKLEDIHDTNRDFDGPTIGFLSFHREIIFLLSMSTPKTRTKVTKGVYTSTIINNAYIQNMD